MPRLNFNRFKVDEPPAAALERYITHYVNLDLYERPDSLPPISPDVIFGDSAPMVVEFGCGRGDFLIAEAEANPDINYLGFDLHWKSLWDCVNKVSAENRSNIHFVRADIRRALFKIPDACVREAMMLFPPPIMKQNRIDREILSQDVFEHIHRILIDGASFHFVTDDPDYFDKKVSMIDGSGWFEKVSTSQQIEGGITAFQRRWERYGTESLRVEFTKLR
jgi:tRNA (guanine-N7-)-methyltransferase